MVVIDNTLLIKIRDIKTLLIRFITSTLKSLAIRAI